NIGSFINLTKYYKYIDSILKEELKQLYINIFSFFKVYFRNVLGLRLKAYNIFNKYKEEDNLLY
ncbi:hypothetical protein BDV96DRAFT_509731, partial [Lophiotrema nucula]